MQRACGDADEALTVRRIEVHHPIVARQTVKSRSRGTHGQVTEQCILYSALDAYVRHFSFVVPPDCVANIDPELGDAALTMMNKNMHAELVPAEKCLR